MIRVTSSVMGTSTLTIRNLAGYDHLISKATTIQCVRWKRKPIWMATAKSKVFKVPQRPQISEEESAELQRLHNNYKTMMKSLRSFFVKKLEEEKVKSNVSTSQEYTDEDFLVRYHINKEWNKQVAAEREDRLIAARSERTEEIIKQLEEKEQRNLDIQREVDAKIRKAKEEAPTFITPDNIDQAIAKALETVVNHNAAIDPEGNYYVEHSGEIPESVKKAENTV
ncbi:mitochondrial ribosomal protein S26 [Lasioglossum baleicum]|uniref:mitochondrial ribosomal protein S26 n=1 Tax=Lasioglossum baleicum TaxID=434251 RepID=UPI003FCE566B